jgi:hypothetical protein
MAVVLACVVIVVAKVHPGHGSLISGSFVANHLGASTAVVNVVPDADHALRCWVVC